MKYADNDSEMAVLIINEHIRLSGIPAEAHRYEVNGRTPLAWFIDRYRIKRDTKSGIVNDPNEMVQRSPGSDRQHSVESYISALKLYGSLSVCQNRFNQSRWICQ